MRPRGRNHPRQGWGEADTRRPDASLVLPVARMDPPSPHEISPLGGSYGNLIFIVNVFVSLSPSIIEFHMLQVHLSQPAQAGASRRRVPNRDSRALRREEGQELARSLDDKGNQPERRTTGVRDLRQARRAGQETTNSTIRYDRSSVSPGMAESLVLQGEGQQNA